MNGAKYVASADSDASATSDDSSSVPDHLLYDVDPAQKLIERHRMLRYPYICTFGSARLEIRPGVFCPVLTRTSPLLLETLTFRPGEKVLDVFAGSGAFGINAALSGARVVMVDTSAVAVACAAENVARNGVADRVIVRQGAMGDCIAQDEAFDLIVANPPLLPGPQADELTQAIFDPGLGATLDFIRRAGRHLKPQGRCYLVTSDVIERYGYDIDLLCAESGLYASLANKLDVDYETYRVHEFVRAESDITGGQAKT